MKKYITEIDIELYKKEKLDPVIIAEGFENADEMVKVLTKLNGFKIKVLGRLIEEGEIVGGKPDFKNSKKYDNLDMFLCYGPTRRNTIIL